MRPRQPIDGALTLTRMMPCRVAAALTLAIALACAQPAAAQQEEFISDSFDQIVASHRQQWGALGRDTAARPLDGRLPSRLRIGERTYKKGLGHHANGEIVLELAGQYQTFRADVGVHWQGGRRGRMVFQVFVDGRKCFDSGPMSDSDAAKPVHVPVAGARTLRLVATDGGNGIACDMANWANARLAPDPSVPLLGRPELLLNGRPAPAASSSVCGFSLIAHDSGPQVAMLGRRDGFTVCLRAGEKVAAATPVRTGARTFTAMAEVVLRSGKEAEVVLSVDGGDTCRKTLRHGTLQLSAAGSARDDRPTIRVETRSPAGAAAVRWAGVRVHMADRGFGVPMLPRTREHERYPPRVLPALRPAIERELVEWDWRMQDGIGTDRAQSTYGEAIERTLRRGDALIGDLRAEGVDVGEQAGQWQMLWREWKLLSTGGKADRAGSEDLWLRVHGLRRTIALGNPSAQVGPLVFAKQVPGRFSHQLTQYYGRYARPGGGIFVLDRPGESMACRELGADALPSGSYMQPEVSYDGKRVLFAYCQCTPQPKDGKRSQRGPKYHLYEMAADGSGLRQLTDGPYDDLAPCELPNGKIVFTSTRRGGWHRCGNPGCETYALAVANRDGSDPRPISRHETHEWDPSVLSDGRLLYTRWDYVDRHAVHYQHLWSVRPDGSGVATYYGNNTFNPVGIWEARQVPGSDKVMATAAAHHAMTAGSIVLVHVARGVDGLQSITRLTPDAPFPESEAMVLPRWRASVRPKSLPVSPEAKRWPGHCYRSPYPLSETYFLAAYSFHPLMGEPNPNRANMFGLYLVDRFGNKELLYRGLNIASLWPVPLRARPRPPALPSEGAYAEGGKGTFYLQNVYESDPSLPPGSIKALRIMQVLPKSTPGANRPRVGLANASPGKQVLGTVPVEPDGSAHFRAPAGTALAFQALDERGQAVQIMRSITYVWPGEHASCVGCHESRLSTPPQMPLAQALTRPPSEIEPGPDGSKPLSYPILVQPVLDKHCVKCHSGPKPKGGFALTGESQGHYTASYVTLAKRVPHAAWRGGDFRRTNSEPVSVPDHFGARASGLMKMLLRGHSAVKLSDGDLERLVTWMDANALFYGTFNPADQARQQRGERIDGPGLE